MNINDILIPERIRRDLGDLASLQKSIKEFGIIEPIVLESQNRAGTAQTSDWKPLLVAGFRRLSALKALGVTNLEHAKHYIWREEEDELRRTAVELEENLRRKDMNWTEIVEGKAKLLAIMQKIHGGPAVHGGRTLAERRSGEPSVGFGVRSLAAMLGESVSSTSRDLKVAEAIRIVPSLAKAETKESAVRKLNTLSTMIAMAKSGAAKAPEAQKFVLYEGNFVDHINKVPNESVDLIYTDMPFGVDLSQMSRHDSGAVTAYSDSRDWVTGLMPDITIQSYRILKQDRYAVFFFGFNYYSLLVNNLATNGFSVNFVPVVWLKHRASTENPNTRYANAYDAALVASKGQPAFIRPGKTNVKDFPAVSAANKLQIAQQPIELVKDFLLDMASPGATVVDLFAGSGTTGEAAIKCGMNPILFEKSKEACDLIRLRLTAL